MATVSVTGTDPIKRLPNQVGVIGMDFTNCAEVLAGEALTGSPTVNYQGIGFKAGAEITVGVASIVGNVVQFLVTLVNAIPGRQYLFDVVCPTNIAGHVAEGVRIILIIGQG